MEIAVNNESLLASITAQIRTFATNVCVNLLQLGRALTEAKPLVPHGEWENYLSANSGMSARYAQSCMQAWERYGSDARVEGLKTGQLFGLLALPESAEDEFFATHNVQEMSAREVREAVKSAREEMQAELDAERERREEAERLLKEADERPAEIPEDVADELRDRREEAERLHNEIERLADAGQSALSEQLRLNSENARLMRELDEKDELMRDQQEEFDRVQTELLNIRSAQARGEEPKATGELSAEVFAEAVRAFIGACARMPHMQRAFGGMNDEEKSEYDELLRCVESWAEGARRALSCRTVEGRLYQ